MIEGRVIPPFPWRRPGGRFSRRIGRLSEPTSPTIWTRAFIGETEEAGVAAWPHPLYAATNLSKANSRALGEAGRRFGSWLASKASSTFGWM